MESSRIFTAMAMAVMGDFVNAAGEKAGSMHGAKSYESGASVRCSEKNKSPNFISVISRGSVVH